MILWCTCFKHWAWTELKSCVVASNRSIVSLSHGNRNSKPKYENICLSRSFVFNASFSFFLFRYYYSEFSHVQKWMSPLSKLFVPFEGYEMKKRVFRQENVSNPYEFKIMWFWTSGQIKNEFRDRNSPSFPKHRRHILLALLYTIKICVFNSSGYRGRAN